MGTDFDYRIQLEQKKNQALMAENSALRIQYSLWNHFLAIPILGRDDYLYGDVYANGNLVNNYMDQKSVGGK